MIFLLDVHIPVSLFEYLNDAGHEVYRGDQIFGPGTSDEAIAAFAAERDKVVVSCDLHFANILRFPPENYPGFVVIRCPAQSIKAIRRVFEAFAATVDWRSTHHRLTIVEAGRIRQFPPSGPHVSPTNDG